MRAFDQSRLIVILDQFNRRIKRNGLVAHVVNDACESSFGVLADELESYENLGLACARGVVLFKKSSDFATRLKNIGKEGVFYFCYLMHH